MLNGSVTPCVKVAFPMRLDRSVLVPLLGSLMLACGSQPPDEPQADPTLVFELAWSTYDTEYPSFSIRGVDWDASRETYRPRVTPQSTDQELFEVLSEMLLELRDGHVAVDSPVGYATYSGWFDQVPANFDETFISRYVGDPVDGVPFTNGVIAGSATDTSTATIGYVHFESFVGPDYGPALDLFLSTFEPLDGLIIDLRNNFGGSDFEVHAVLGRLIEVARDYRRVRFRDGPGRDDFGDWFVVGIEPIGSARYLGPIVVLTNRRVYSSAESMLIALRTRPHVTIVGDTTGGGSSSPRWAPLPRGFWIRVPQWQEEDLDGNNYESIGIQPDEWIGFTSADIASGRDPILERAIDLLMPNR